MLYFLAFVFPPAAILMRGRIFQAWFSAALWAIALVAILFLPWALWAWPLGWAHGLFVVYYYKEDHRQKQEPGGQAS